MKTYHLTLKDTCPQIAYMTVKANNKAEAMRMFNEGEVCWDTLEVEHMGEPYWKVESIEEKK